MTYVTRGCFFYPQFQQPCPLACNPTPVTIAVFTSKRYGPMSDDHDDSVLDPNAIDEMAEEVDTDEEGDGDSGEEVEESM